MKIQLLTLSTVVLLAASCSNGGNTESESASSDPKACDCVDVYKTDDTAAKAKCDELRKTTEYDDQFRKCLAASITGRNPEEVNLVKSDQMKMEIPADGDYAFSPEKSKIVWTGSKVTGAKHSGLISVKHGVISFANGEISNAKLILDMESITCTDKDLPEDKKANLVGHLTSDDFFDVSNHPEAYFAFENAKMDGSKAEINGTLSIKGVVKPATINVMFSSTGENGAVVSGSTIIDRAEFDVRYGSGKFFEGLGDNLINDDILLSFQLKGTK